MSGVTVVVAGPVAEADAWEELEVACIDLLPHHRRMRVLEIADDSGLSEFQAFLVTALAESIRRQSPIAEF